MVFGEIFMANNEIKEWPPITGSSSRTKRVHVAAIILRLLFRGNRKRFRVLQRVPVGEFSCGQKHRICQTFEFKWHGLYL